MIRRPIAANTARVLSLVAIALLVLGYTWLSHRQHVTNPDDTTMPTWRQLERGE